MSCDNSTTVTAKSVADFVTIVFDFGQQVLAGVHIVSAVSTIRVEAGTDPSPANVLSGQPFLDIATPSQAVQWVQDGIAGVLYHITCTATLSDGQILTLACLLPVKNI